MLDDEQPSVMLVLFVCPSLAGAQSLRDLEDSATSLLSWKSDLQPFLGQDFETMEETLQKPPGAKDMLLSVYELMAADLLLRSRRDLAGVAKQLTGFHTFTNKTLCLLKKDLSPKIVAALDKIAKDANFDVPNS